MAAAGGYAPLGTTAGDEGPSAMERIEAARATIAANKAARAERGSPLRPESADQTPRMDEEEAGEQAPLVEGPLVGEAAARSDEVIVAVGRDAVPDEQPSADEEKVKDDKRRFRVRCCQSPEEIQLQAVRTAEERHAAALEAAFATADALPLDEKIEALWGWVDKSFIKYDNDDKRYLKLSQITAMAAEMEMEPEALRELLGVEWPVRGPRAVLGGRAGTVIRRYVGGD
eukprot:COSAG04_NODE_3514_length_2749_cov_59.658708_2_plen_228_part_01